MAAAAAASFPGRYAGQDPDLTGFDPSLKKPLIVSGVLHIGLFIFSLVGLPHFMPPPPVTPHAISIELVAPIDTITQTNKMAKPVKAEEKKPEPIAKPEKPAPPPMDAASVPDEAVEKPDAVPTPDVIKKPEKPEKKPPVKKPVVKMPDEKKPTKDQKDFDALLKNLTPDAQENTPEDAVETADKTASADSLIAKLSDRMTISEEDALIRQLAQCWNIPAGARNAENLMIEVQVNINPDRTVRDAKVVNNMMYAGDPHFRAAADAALRALRHPLCTPLQLPPEKYNQWKSTIIVFDPRQML